MKFRLFFLFLVLTSFTLTAKGDSSSALAYNINGIATITGNNNCGGPCVETIDYSFQVDYVPFQGGPSLLATQVGPATYSAIGPLGTFSGGSCCGGLPPPYGYIEIVGSQGFDYIDIVFGNLLIDSAAGGPPVALDSYIFLCSSAVCAADFSPTGTPTANIYGGTNQLTATLVPEPSSALLLSFGVLVLALLRDRDRWLRRLLYA